MGKDRKQGITGAEKTDRVHDRNTSPFSKSDCLSKYGGTAYSAGIPDRAVIEKCLETVGIKETGKRQYAIFHWVCARDLGLPLPS